MKLWNRRQHKKLRGVSRKIRDNFLAACSVCLLAAFVACAALGIDGHPPASSSSASRGSGLLLGRRLSGGGGIEPKCDDHPDSMEEDLERWWYFPPMGLVYLGGLLWLFVGIAMVCDTFFEPALDAISTKLRLTKDVAGATFMAAGSSAPEFFTSLADAFITKSGAGIGTIVGSAMFNILVIVAASSLLSGQTSLAINWRPIVRDSSFYLLSIFMLYVLLRYGSEEKYFSKDGVGYIEWWEGLIMWLTYVAYIGFMVINGVVFWPCSAGRCCCCRVAPRTGTCKNFGWVFSSHKQAAEEDAAADGAVDAIEDAIATKIAAASAAKPEGVREPEGEANDDEVVDEEAALTKGEKAEAEEEEEEEEEPESMFEFPQYESVIGDDSPLAAVNRIVSVGLFVGKLVLYFLALPYTALFTITIPNCDRPRFEQWYIVTFLSCICWMGGLCACMVTLGTMLGCSWRIDPVVMGVLVLAAGTSVPDLIASVIVARQGEGSMAIANAIGSNVFDILLGLVRSCFPDLPFHVMRIKLTI